MTSERDEWPRPFGALAGRLPSIEIEDIKAARREALGGDADELSRTLGTLGAPLE